MDEFNMSQKITSKDLDVISRFHKYMKQHNTFGYGHNYMNNYQILFTSSLGLILPIILLIDLLK